MAPNSASWEGGCPQKTVDPVNPLPRSSRKHPLCFREAFSGESSSILTVARLLFALFWGVFYIFFILVLCIFTSFVGFIVAAGCFLMWLFWHRSSLCIPGWSQSFNPPVSGSQGQACTATPAALMYWCRMWQRASLTRRPGLTSRSLFPTLGSSLIKYNQNTWTRFYFKAQNQQHALVYFGFLKHSLEMKLISVFPTQIQAWAVPLWQGYLSTAVGHPLRWWYGGPERSQTSNLIPLNSTNFLVIQIFSLPRLLFSQLFIEYLIKVLWALK